MAIYFGATIEEKLIEADAYFDADVSGGDWDQYTDDDKKRGLQQAEREIDLFAGTDLESIYEGEEFPLIDSGRGKNYRPDYACIEHAFWLLDETARTKDLSQEKYGGVRMVESEKYQERKRNTGVGLSPKAMRWLAYNTIEIGRG